MSHDTPVTSGNLMPDGNPYPVSKPEAQWRDELTPLEDHVLREAGPERPFVGEYTDTKTNRAAIKTFFASKHDELPPMVFEASASWDVSAAEKLALDAQVMPCRDPLAHGLSKAKEVYYRLAGPAGHKSRYEDAPLEALAELARKAKHDRVFYIFSNVDMGQDAKRLQKALGGA